MGTPEVNATGKPLWAEIASDEAFASREARVEELFPAVERAAIFESDREKYYWKDGLPTLEVLVDPFDEQEGITHIFTADQELHTRRSVLAQAVLNRSKRAKVVYKTNAGARIIEKDDRQCIVVDKNQRVSPFYDSIISVGERDFSVRKGEHTAKIRLLANKDQSLYKNLEANSHELNTLQASVAADVLAKFGITATSREKDVAPENGQTCSFEYAGNMVCIGIHQGVIDVAAWPGYVSPATIFGRWKHFAKGVSRINGQIPYPAYNTELGVPILLHQHRHQLPLRDIRASKEIHDSMEALEDAMQAFAIGNHLRSFSIQTSHMSWALPVVMRLIELPFEEAYTIIGPNGSHIPGAFRQDRPGSFFSIDTGHEWKINKLHP